VWPRRQQRSGDGTAGDRVVVEHSEGTSTTWMATDAATASHLLADG
jgi:hypothetical protein